MLFNYYVLPINIVQRDLRNIICYLCYLQYIIILGNNENYGPPHVVALDRLVL